MHAPTLRRSILQIPFALSAFDAIHSVPGNLSEHARTMLCLSQCLLCQCASDAVAAHVAGLTAPLRLTAGTLGAILQCVITRWDDPALKALNPSIQ